MKLCCQKRKGERKWLFNNVQEGFLYRSIEYMKQGNFLLIKNILHNILNSSHSQPLTQHYLLMVTSCWSLRPSWITEFLQISKVRSGLNGSVVLLNMIHEDKNCFRMGAASHVPKLPLQTEKLVKGVSLLDESVVIYSS